MKASHLFVRSLIAILFAAASALAGEVTIDVSGVVNEPWNFVGPTEIINPSTFPIGNQTFGGVPFVIPTAPNNFWLGAAAADFGPGPVSITIPVGVQGVTSVYTLLNTFWSQPGPNAYLYITFTGSAGATFTKPLVGGVNVRDYNNDGFQNTINNTSTVQVWTNGEGQRLDRQEYILPAAFASQVLTTVTITDTGDENFSRGMFTGLTVSTCPAYVTEGITISSTPIIYDTRLRLYEQRVSLSNTGTTAVRGPMFLILESLPAGVTLVNPSKPTACIAPIGSQYIVVLPPGSSLAPDTTINVGLAYSDPTAATITYTPLTVIGSAP